MRAQILKIAGVKSEEEFYKKYPTEKAFMAQHGKALKKAQNGIQQAKPMMDTSVFGDGGGKQSFAKGQNPMFRENLSQTIGQGASIIGKGIEGFQALKAEKDQLNSAIQMKGVTDAGLMAINSDRGAEEVARQRQDMQVNPWDNVVTPEQRMDQFANTNVLAKKGKKMNDGGFMKMMDAGGSNIVNQGIDKWTNNSGGAQVGEAVGDAVKMIPGVGPVAGAVITPALKAIGHLALSQGTANKTGKAKDFTASNIQDMSGINFGNAMNNKNSAFVEKGGNFTDMGGDIQTTFGGNAEKLSYNPFAPGDGETAILKGDYHTEGGIGLNYGNNQIEAEHDEPIVKNDENSVSVLGRLDLPKGLKKAVQASTGEKLAGNKFNSLVKSIGKIEERENSKIAKGAEKSEKYSPLNTLDRVSLATIEFNKNKISMPKLAALQDAKEGITAVQDAYNEVAEEQNLNPDKLISGKAIKAKRGRKMSYSQLGSKEEKGGPTKTTKEEATKMLASGEWEAVEGKPNNYVKRGQPGSTETFTVFDETIDPNDDPKPLVGKAPATTNQATDVDAYLQGIAKQERFKGISGDEMANKKWFSPDNIGKWNKLTNWNPGEEIIPDSREEILNIDGTPDQFFYSEEEKAMEKEKKKGKFPWMDIAGQIPQLFKNSDAERFDNRQLIPEINALATNQLEPVDAQKFNPRLNVPFDVSYQEALNNNRSNARSAERLAAHSPGVLANLKAQEYQGNQNVLAQQFRANQAKKDAVYSDNRNKLDEADKFNLGIMDQQYTRQATAKSITKATNQAAFNSISDKLAKHRLENKTLKAWENTYDGRFDANGVYRYQGAPMDIDAMWNNVGGGAQGNVPEGYEISGYNKAGKPFLKPIGTKSKKQPDLSNTPFNGIGKNGMLVKKLKKLK